MDKAALARLLDPDAYTTLVTTLPEVQALQARRDYAEYHAAHLIDDHESVNPPAQE